MTVEFWSINSRNINSNGIIKLSNPIKESQEIGGGAKCSKCHGKFIGPQKIIWGSWILEFLGCSKR